MAPPFTFAIDLGGTHLRVARVDAAGCVHHAVRAETPTANGPDAVVEAMLALLARVRAAWPSESGRCAGIGIAAPGPLDPATGVIFDVPNMPGWHGFPLVDRLRQATGLPAWAHNDANLAGLAEARLGAGRGHDPLIYLTVSTGVGGAILIGGEMFVGRHGMAGELGHAIVRAGGPACGLGHPGCLEGMASGTAIARRARAAIDALEPTAIPRYVERGAAVSAEAVANAARDGDPLAAAIFSDAGEALGTAIGSFVNIFDPSRIVIGGGVSRSWDLLAAPMWAAVGVVAMAQDVRPVDIVPAALGDDAGIIGAGLYALDRA